MGRIWIVKIFKAEINTLKWQRMSLTIIAVESIKSWPNSFADKLEQGFSTVFYF